MNGPQDNGDKGKGGEDEKHPGGKAPPVPPLTVDPGLQGVVEELRRKERDNARNDQAEQKRQRILERTAIWQARAAVAIVFLTVAGLVINYWQSSATRDQNSAMVKQLDLMQLDQRPWLSITDRIKTRIEVGKAFDWRCRIKNAGKTPGTIIEEAFVVSYMKADDPRIRILGERIIVMAYDIGTISNDLEKDGTKMRSKTVIPSGDSEQVARTGLRILNDEEVMDISAGRLIPVCFYRIAYLDSAGQRHMTFSCFSYNARSESWEKQGQYGRMD